MNIELALETADKINGISHNAKKVFVERNEVIDAMAITIASGQHMFMLGKPGTSKSLLVRYFSESMNMNFFRTLLNPDIVWEDLVGPLSLQSLRKDQWEHKWSGLARANFALLDEIGKASPQVANKLLDALEERLISTPDHDLPIPLHSAFAASNETLDLELSAIWDRFMIRLHVPYIEEPNNFFKLLTTEIDLENLQKFDVTSEELNNIRKTSKSIALNISSDVKDAMYELWSEIPGISPAYEDGDPISDRRWRNLLVCAAGKALIEEREKIVPNDLIVSKWILWSNFNDIEVIHNWIEEKFTPMVMDTRDIRALVVETITDCFDTYIDQDNMFKLDEPDFLSIVDSMESNTENGMSYSDACKVKFTVTNVNRLISELKDEDGTLPTKVILDKKLVDFMDRFVNNDSNILD